MALVARACLSSRLSILRHRQCLIRSCYASTTSGNDFKMVSLKSISAEDLGHSILHKKEHTGIKSATDTMGFGIKCAKFCSIGSSALGIVMMPVLSSYFGTEALERPGVMLFTFVANSGLAILALTPLLLHSLTRRFVLDVYYNAKTEVFTTVHYNFLLQKRALRFKASDAVLPENSEHARKMWIPLATCFVHKYPLLLLLDPEQYSDKFAFHKLAANLPEKLEEKSN